MTDEQGGILLNVINGPRQEPLPSGFIIDSPWLPDCCGIGTLDDYSND